MKLIHYPGLLILIAVFFGCNNADKIKISKVEAEKDKILARITPPEFKKDTFNILSFYTLDSVLSNCKPAIDNAIELCANSGGGTVLIPAGNYLCKGPIHLLSGVNLHFEKGAEILFSSNPDDYLPLVFVRWEGLECYNYSPYFYAINQKNIAITGHGILNGNAKGAIFEWRYKQEPSQKLLRQMGKDGIALEERRFGKGHFIRPSFIQFMNCSNVLISDIYIENVPFWVVHPTYCKNVSIKNVTVNSRNINNDGVDLDSCEEVLVEDCHFITGDDAIAIKSGRDQDAWRVGKPSKNIIIQNCYAELTLHGLAFGSEMSGGVENVYIKNLHFQKVDEYAIQFKANLDRGGYVRNIFIDDITIDTTNTVLYFTNNYHSYTGGENPSTFSHITIKNITNTQFAEQAIDILGLPQMTINNILLENFKINGAQNLGQIKHVEKFRLKEFYINSVKILTYESFNK